MLKGVNVWTRCTSESHHDGSLIIFSPHEYTIYALKLGLAATKSGVGAYDCPSRIFLLFETPTSKKLGQLGLGQIFSESFWIGHAFCFQPVFFLFDDAIGVFKLDFVLVVVTSALNFCLWWNKLGHFSKEVVRAEWRKRYCRTSLDLALSLLSSKNTI